MRSVLCSVAVAALLWTSPLAQQQAARPVTLVSQVRAAVNAHDLARAEALVKEQRAEKGDTPEVLEALSWLGRGALFERQFDRAAAFAEESQRLGVAALGGKSVNTDPHLEIAIGAGIEVQAQVAAERGQRSEAIVFLQRELERYRGTVLTKRIQKNINLLTLEGHPAPALSQTEWIGAKPPSLAELKGKVIVLFFWAHWCPDCKKEGPVLDTLFNRYQKQGLTIVAPTQRYGYVASGAKASPEDELQYIVQIRDKFYPFLAHVPVPVSVADHERFGVSTTPTNVIIDRQGIIRLYHPGQMTEQELDAKIRELL